MKTPAKRFILAAIATPFALSLAPSAHAVTLIPPNDQVGAVYSTNSNDAWSSGRGITFQVSGPTPITSVGLYQNLTGINLSWKINDFNNQANVFASGGSVETTSGLQWIDFPTSVNLSTGTTYHLEFKFSGNSNQNFFYNNGNVQWSQDGFTFLDGTQGGGAGNFVVAAFRVNTPPANAPAVPDGGSTIALLGLAMTAVAGARRKFGI